MIVITEKEITKRNDDEKMMKENENNSQQSTTVVTCSMTWELIPIEMHMTLFSQTVRVASLIFFVCLYVTMAV